MLKKHGKGGQLSLSTTLLLILGNAVAQEGVTKVPGSLDKSFGNAGVVSFRAGVYRNRDHIGALALTQDGKILLGGQINSKIAIYRLLANGKIDPSFGNKGLVQSASAIGTVAKLLIQKDGSIIAVGSHLYNQSGVVLAKFTSQGKPDLSFGKKGVTEFKSYGNAYHRVTGAALQPDGKIVVGGSASNDMGPSQLMGGKSLLVRFNSDGSVDRGFGKNGEVFGIAQSFGTVSDIEIDKEGKILAIGSAYNQYGDSWDTRTNDVAYLARFNRTGDLDMSFGSRGIVTFSAEERTVNIFGSSLNLLPDGRILTVVNMREEINPPFEEVSRIRLTQYLPDGSRDNSFGQEGKVSYNFGYSASGGEIVRSGTSFFLTAWVQPSKSDPSSSSLLKMDNKGRLDKSFDYDGRVGIGSLHGLFNPVPLNNGQILLGSGLSPYFQDYDDSEPADKINVELFKVNP